jgi:hypothetical protein
MIPKTERKLENDPATQATRGKRLGQIDMHTDLSAEFAKVKALSVKELINALNSKYISTNLKQAATVELRNRMRTMTQSERDSIINSVTHADVKDILSKPIDPLDKDTVEV